MPTAFSPASTAEYISDMTRELARMARAAKLDVLASVLDVAKLEAGQTAARLASTRERSAAG